MNGSRYLNSLREELKLPTDVHRYLFFMHDETSHHMSRAVMDDLTAEKIPALDRPVKSPDLNYIENHDKKHPLWTELNKQPIEQLIGIV